MHVDLYHQFLYCKVLLCSSYAACHVLVMCLLFSVGELLHIYPVYFLQS